MLKIISILVIAITFVFLATLERPRNLGADAPIKKTVSSSAQTLAFSLPTLLAKPAYADSCKQVNESCMYGNCCSGLACAGQWPDVTCKGF